MCLLILNKAGAPNLTREQFKNAWGNNPHGGGFVYNRSGKQVAKKVMTSWELFYEEYIDARIACPATHFIVHFRWATHGSKTLDNTHPFKVWSGLHFAHNGVLSAYGNREAKSDTRDFNDRILKLLPDHFYLNQDYVNMLSDHIGAGNKFVFLDDQNEYGIVNESAGHWVEGNWFSNSSYRGSSSYSFRAPKVDETEKKSKKKNKKSDAAPYGDAAKIDAKYKAWNKKLADAIKAGAKTPNYLDFAKKFETEWAKKQQTPGTLWRAASEIDM